MSLDDSRIRELLSQTRLIFGSIPRPRCTKRIARALDDEWTVSQERGDELSSLDTEQNWWEVSDEHVLEYCDVLFWISPEGFRFYYPAFLSYTLRHWCDMHNRVHMETFEVIGTQTAIIQMLTREELAFIDETLVELSCDPRGSHYEWIPTLIAVESQLRLKAQ